jgi:hypothetical protein
MIIPTTQDANLLLRFREEPIRLSFLNEVASDLCESRGEKPIIVRWIISVKKAIFHPIKWVIVIPRMSVLDFFHEVGHMLNVIDRGRNGSEEDAEVFAHGVCSWLWPESYGMDDSVRWYFTENNIMRRILWTSNYLNQLTRM